MAQVQCPNDGGYKVSTTVVVVDRKTGKEVEKAGCGCWSAALLGIFFAIVFLVMGIGSLVDHESLEGGIIGLVSGLCIVGFIVLWMVLQYKDYYKADKIIKYKHECLLCGYRWERREGEPPPEVHVRPDLIAKGAQRLEEEAAERRHQEEAAAHAFLEQQRRKK